MPNPQQSAPRGAPGWAETQKFRQCLPITEVPEPPTGGKGGDYGPSCQDNPGCANLVGECCPTIEGMLLGCCSDDNAPPLPPPAPPLPPPDRKDIFGRDVGGPGGEDAPHGTGPGGKGGGGGDPPSPDTPHSGDHHGGHSASRGDHGAASSDSACERNSDCAVLGLTGECCPTLEGTQLGCC